MRPTSTIRRAGLAIGLASLALTLTAGPAAADPPTNSSFELPDLAGGTATVCASTNPNAIPGWVVVADCVHHAEGAGGIPASDGTQWVDMEAGAADSGVIQQVFNTAANTGYTITWNFGANGADGLVYPRTGTFSVQGAAVEFMSVSPISATNPNYQTRSTTFAGTGGPVTLQFAATGTPTGFGLIIDNVNIVANTAIPIVDPKVAGIVLTLAAGGGLYLLHRKRTNEELGRAVAG